MDNFEVIVIGAGHAGIEAALASTRLGCRTAIITLRKDTIGATSCNPAIGGVGKGQLVKEIDALGGEMSHAADACGIQFRILNASKGPAVQSSRAQIDKYLYQKYMRGVLAKEHSLSIIESEVKRLIIENGIVKGVITSENGTIESTCVVICPGTFFNGLIHVGLKHFPGGRINEQSSSGLPENLKSLGFSILRFKTGTCPRLDKNSIDFAKLTVQNGDTTPRPFSFSTEELKQRQVPCHITYTNPATHKIILDNLDKSPLYAGIIKATGVRYCPSIEDKIVKFRDKQRHQIFLEPEGCDTEEIYPNGLSTSLPEDVQLEILRSIEGLEETEVIRFGYGIEHDVVEPTQLYPTLETKLIKNLYLAGQINGTTGYEEAAAQGLIAGINAARHVQKNTPLILDRSTSYMGVLVDDLTTKGTQEPYRMFTSRVEYRLVLREDNADLRLGRIGYEIGLVKRDDYLRIQEKESSIARGLDLLNKQKLKPAQEINKKLLSLNTSVLKKAFTLEEILKRPQISFADLKEITGIELDIPEPAFQQIEIEVKYRGFIKRQESEIEKFKNLEKIRLPEYLDYDSISGLSREIREKIKKFRPLNLGQASRISGITPAAISILMVYLKKTSVQRKGDNGKHDYAPEELF